MKTTDKDADISLLKLPHQANGWTLSTDAQIPPFYVGSQYPQRSLHGGPSLALGLELKTTTRGAESQSGGGAGVLSLIEDKFSVPNMFE
ncbi:hypothetical protein TNCV_2629201 [Trichonephila clavipes]|uniref:Uncharacterized protein n=1 Tax=Trichonephila clavipes TaxID=2585209 RepID=A0A8X6SBS6_TRICX|nr:hypothetical protein TNCV_2629201 [Trichonephila clavipes]